MPGARCTRGLIRKGRRARMSIQAQRRHPGIPCAMVYGLFRALPGDRAWLPPSPAGTPRKLDASIGRQDHTALPSASVPFVFDTACVHRIPRQRFVTTMIRPSERARDGEAYRGVSGQTRSDIFLQPGLDIILLICPSGSPVIPGREAKRSEPGIHNHRCLLSEHSGPSFAPHQHSWLWIPGSTLTRRPGMTKEGSALTHPGMTTERPAPRDASRDRLLGTFN